MRDVDEDEDEDAAREDAARRVRRELDAAWPPATSSSTPPPPRATPLRALGKNMASVLRHCRASGAPAEAENDEVGLVESLRVRSDEDVAVEVWDAREEVGTSRTERVLEETRRRLPEEGVTTREASATSGLRGDVALVVLRNPAQSGSETVVETLRRSRTAATRTLIAVERADAKRRDEESARVANALRVPLENVFATMGTFFDDDDLETVCQSRRCRWRWRRCGRRRTRLRRRRRRERHRSPWTTRTTTRTMNSHRSYFTPRTKAPSDGMNGNRSCERIWKSVARRRSSPSSRRLADFVFVAPKSWRYSTSRCEALFTRGFAASESNPRSRLRLRLRSRLASLRRPSLRSPSAST